MPDMTASQGVQQIAALLMVALSAAADPSCTLYGPKRKDLVCTAGNEDYALKRGLVSDNNRTTGITLRECRITDIEMESFHDLHNLKYLDLSKNNIQMLKLGVLDGFKQLTYLNLSYNMLNDLPLGIFDQKPNLDLLDLKGNRIDSLKLGVFDALSKLTHLDLSSNPILGEDIDPYVFRQCKNIRYMDFSRNDMTETSDILLSNFQSLDILNLDKSYLTGVPKFATASNLRTMRNLLLSGNRISNIDDSTTFINLDNLETLNLGWNIIVSLNENVFHPLKKIKIISLTNNHIKSLPDKLFQNLVRLGNIDLSYNEIEFIPVNAFRGTSIKNLNLSHNRFSYLTDNFCLELKNSGGALSKFYFNNNPWQCSCLRDILKEVKVFGIRYNSNKYDGKNTVCVTTKEYNCKRHANFNQIYIDLYNNINNVTVKDNSEE